MSVRRFAIGGAGCVVQVTAHSRIHDVVVRNEQLEGEVRGDPDHVAETLVVHVQLPTASFSTGDTLKDWKLRDTIEPSRWPRAELELTRVLEAEAMPGGNHHLECEGVIRYREREAHVRITAEGRLDGDCAIADARFRVNMRSFELDPPRFLMFRMDDEIDVDVHVVARAVS